ncbi:MAG TPA: hypothetical protein VKP30_19665, partial [Polyangiaceae bacterium]|nr:hypothetical protein [Polyangiaceae bacterium]
HIGRTCAKSSSSESETRYQPNSQIGCMYGARLPRVTRNSSRANRQVGVQLQGARHTTINQ